MLVLGAWLGGCDSRPAESWQTEVEAAIVAGEYAPVRQGDGWVATNRAHGLRVSFGPGGVAVADRRGGGEARIEVARWGRPGTEVAMPAVSAADGGCAASGARDPSGACARRIAYARDNLTEWWENGPAGLELGFTLPEPPKGAGHLVIDLRVEGASVAVGRDTVTLGRPGREPLRLGGMAAWDALGRTLPSGMAAVAGGVRLWVDDAGAVGEITVDPLLTVGTWTAAGDQDGAALGTVVASAGDVDGDGFGDLLVGAPGYDRGMPDEGAAFLYRGSAAGLEVAASWTAGGNQAAAAFGQSVAAAGDVNGDGYGDVVVGSPGWSGSLAGEGKAWVYLGSSAGLELAEAWSAEGGQADARFGAAVACAGDVNGDAHGDVVVGGPGLVDTLVGEGGARLFLGSEGGLAGAPSWSAYGGSADGAFGSSVASGGDVDADGYGDVLIGAPQATDGASEEGAAFLYRGGSTGLEAGWAWRALGEAASAGFGASLASAGDVDGDGYGDVVVGAPGAGVGGRAALYRGSAAGLEPASAWAVDAVDAGGSFGAWVASAGDLDGDGYGDVVVGAPNADFAAIDAGQVSVWLGGPAGLGATADWILDGAAAGDRLGAAAAGGDVDGDGFGDLAIGQPGFSGGAAGGGGAVVWRGAPTALGGVAWSAEGDQANAAFGLAVASAGDVNGDGFDDVIVGAQTYDAVAVDAGGAFLYLGSAAGLSPVAAWSKFGLVGDKYGCSVASAGDVNGDGYADVVVGANYFNNGYQDHGRAYVYLGSPTGLGAGPAWTGTGQWTSDHYGTKVAGVGDLDGDGYDEVAVTSSGYGSPEDDEGKVYVYFGSVLGLSTVADFTDEGDQAYSAFGSEIGSAGDLNGDGYGDLLIASSGYDNGELSEGMVFVYAGSPAGLAPDPTWALQVDQAYAQFGSAASSAGDVNGDGYGDLLVGAELWDAPESNEGRAFLFLGSAGGVSASPAWSADVDVASAWFGDSVASAGDLNGDGFGDVVVGAYAYDVAPAGDANGQVRVFLGSAAGLEAEPVWSVNGPMDDATLGKVASAGDVNGDGYGDLLLGAYGYTGGQTAEGAAFLYLGNGGHTAPLSRVPQALDPASGDPISPGQRSSLWDGFDVAVGQARGSWGSSRVGIAVEVEPLGTPFDGQGLVTSPETTASGLTGVALEQAIRGLVPETAYHWRVRVVASPAEGRPQGWGPWMYGGTSGHPLGSHLFTGDALFFTDADRDGFGDPATGHPVAAAFDTNDATDCDDTNAGVSPGDPERCDAQNVDDDCDGAADDLDDSPVGTVPWHADADGDGFGGVLVATMCDGPVGTVRDATDCDDDNGAIYPGAGEICDAADVDEDCSGAADDADGAASGRLLVHRDDDNDGFGAATAVFLCDPGAEFVADGTDCDDANAERNPAETEVCDSLDVDEDCDGDPDDADLAADGKADAWADGDGDGFGAGALTAWCDRPPGFAAISGDCDDTRDNVHPGGVELCDAVDRDEDCDGDADDADPSALGQRTYFVDADGDLWGGPVEVRACDPQPGRVGASGDCDDTVAAIHPTAAEAPGDGIDADCDGVDRCFTDADGDGFRPDDVAEPATSVDCSGAGEANAASLAGDCDDGDPDAWPGAGEVPADGVDQDCDGGEVCYVDADDDGFVLEDGATAASADPDCDDPGEAAAFDPLGDCDDARSDRHPGAIEADCTDPLDYNCDGSTGYADVDADGFAACADCADTRGDAHPDADETCNGADDDCDGAADEAATDEGVWLPDADADGFTAPTGAVSSCDPPSGFAAETEADCDDADPATWPGAPETEADGIDQDCDGADAAGPAPPPPATGCGCRTPGGPGALLPLLLAAVAVRRRREFPCAR